MRVKLAKSVMAVFVAVAFCMAPYARAYAVAVPAAVYAGRALAAVLAVYGVSTAISSDDDAAALWSDWELYTDDLEGIAVSVGQLQDAAIATGGLTNAAKSQASQEQIDAINDVFAAAGEVGSFALDQLATVKDNVLGLLPFLLASYVDARLLGTGVDHVGDITMPGVTVPLVVSSDDLSLGLPLPSTVTSEGYNFVSFLTESQSGVMRCSVSTSETPILSLYISSDGSYNFSFSRYGLVLDSSSGWNIKSYSSHGYYSDNMRSFTIASGSSVLVSYYSAGTVSELGTYNTATGVWSGQDGVWTDNPDVNLGHDWWDDARERADVLNPATGAAVIGADAVIDGDYVRNRGSIAIPTDYSNINSWADALAATRAGVVEGALDGTVSTTQTGTAVNVGSGELVTDTVGELVKPDAGTSVSPNTNFDWGNFLDPQLYLVFPFCLPWDLVDLVKTLSAEPQAPVIEWYMPTLGGGEVLRIDLSPWSPVAAVLRAGELVVAAVGLIWITKTMIKV